MHVNQAEPVMGNYSIENRETRCTLGGSRHSERVIYICFIVEISIPSYLHVNQAEPVMGNYSDKP